jgi:hypothetical protein
MYNGIPFSADYINAANSVVSPSTVHCRNTTLSLYFQRYLLQKAMSVFKWEMPVDWSKNYTLYTLYCWGFFAVVNTDRYGVIPQACGLRGYDVFYQPTHAIITNPLLSGTLEPRIGLQCELVRLQPDYGGIMDIVSYYADMLALCAESVGMNLVNSKLAYVFAAENKAMAETFKKLYDQIAAGNVSAVIDKQLFREDGKPNWQMFNQNVGQNYVADKVLSDMRKIESMFCTEVGIPNANTDKKERLITDEVNANNIETRSKCDLWLEELKESCAKVRDMFGIKLDVNWRYKGGAEDGSNEPDGAL